MTPLSLPSHTKVSILCEINTFPGGSKTIKKIWKSRVKALRNAFLNSDVHTLGFQMHLGLKNIVIVHFSRRRKNQTMVDKIPWDTCVIALIFCVFKTEFYKSTVFRLKLRCFPLPPSPHTMLKLWRNSMYTCPTL